MKTLPLFALLVAPAAAQGPAEGSSPQVVQQPLLLYWRQTYDEDREGESWGLMRRMRDYLQANYPHLARPRVYLEAFGGGGVAHWFRAYDDLAARLNDERSEGRDAGWRTLRDESRDVYEDHPAWDGYLLPIAGADSMDELRPFREVRMVRAAPARVDAARRHARDVALFLEQHYPEVEAAAYSADLHDPGAIYWLVDYYDLSSWTLVRARLLEDDAYLELQRQGEELFLAEGGVEKMLVDFEFDWSSPAAHFGQAEALDRRGDLIGAAACYRRALELDPGMAQAAHLLGHALEHLGDPAGALESYEHWLQLRPDEPMAYRDLAWVLATTTREDLREPERALQLAQRAVELDPNESLFWLTLGVSRYRTGDLEGCVEALDRSVALDGSGDPYEWLFLAMAHHRIGDADEAQVWFGRSMDWIAENGPDPDYTRYSLRRAGEMAEFLAEAREVLEAKGGER